MPDRIVSHALEQVEESYDVAVDVGIGVFDRIAYAGLCRQIDDGIEFSVPNRFCRACRSSRCIWKNL